MRRTQSRVSQKRSHRVRAKVKSATVPAIMRWLCSKSTPPIMGGKALPKDKGQSGTERLEPVEVTNPPAIKSRKALVAVIWLNLAEAFDVISFPPRRAVFQCA